MAVTIAGRQFWLWRAVDDEGEVLDLLVQRRRDKAAAVKLLRKLLKKQSFATRCFGDRRATFLRRGKVRDRIVGSPRPRLTREQSGREFASADTTARAQDATFQIARISSTLLVHSRRRPKTLSTSSAISHPAARFASSEKKPSGRGELLPQPEPVLGLPIFRAGQISFA